MVGIVALHMIADGGLKASGTTKITKPQVVIIHLVRHQFAALVQRQTGVRRCVRFAEHATAPVYYSECLLAEVSSQV